MGMQSSRQYGARRAVYRVQALRSMCNETVTERLSHVRVRWPFAATSRRLRTIEWAAGNQIGTRRMKREAVAGEEQFFPRTYKLAQIIALVATPIAVAFIGWSAQRSAADANMNSQTLAASIAASAQKSTTESGIQRDLVQTAVRILSSPRRPDDVAIRDWATKIMAKYSPVPFSTKEADQLSRSVFTMLDDNPLLKPAMEAHPPCPAIDVRTLPAPQARDVQQLQAVCIRNAKDLFWLKVFIGLARGPSHANDASPASSAGKSR